MVSHRFLLMAVFGAALSAFFPTSARAAAPPKLGLAKPVHVVCVHFDVAPAPRKATCQDWVDELNREVSAWYDAVSDHRESYTFMRAPIQANPIDPPPLNDWFELVYPPNGFYLNTLSNDILPPIDNVIDFSAIDHLVIISAGPEAFGQSVHTSRPDDGVLGTWDVHVDEGREFDLAESPGNFRPYRRMAIALLGENQASDPLFLQESSAILVHEFGHLHGHPDRYASYILDGSGRDFGTGYTPMALQWSGQINALNVHYLAFEQHWMGFAADAAPWLEVPMNPMPQEFDLVWLTNASPPAGHLSMLTIPVDGNGQSFATFRGYTVEARERNTTSIVSDSVLQQGVVVTYVDAAEPDYSRRLKVVDDPDHPADLWNAAFEVGDRFEDLGRGVTIEVIQQLATGYRVRIGRTTPGTLRPDASITPWTANGWETPDIWIDSPVNGWGTFSSPDGNRDAPAVRASPSDPQIGNRVYYRVTNRGMATAQNNTVRLFYAAPGIAQTSWTQVGGSQPLGAIAPGASTVGYFDGWVLPDGFANGEPHACVKIEITSDASDLDLGNNMAQENIFSIETIHASPWHPRGRLITVTNPSAKLPAHVIMHVKGLPPGWAVRVSPQGFALDPLKTQVVDFVLYPAGSPAHPAPFFDPGTLAKVSLSAQLDYATVPSVVAGGVTAWLRLTEITSTTLAVTSAGKSATLKACVTRTAGSQPVGNAAVGVLYWKGGTSAWAWGTTAATGCASIDTPAAGGLGAYTARAFYAGAGINGSSRSATVNYTLK